eukprot:COSAG01_NODE_35467_length_531_cov_1.155093_1_plen_22_part_10
MPPILASMRLLTVVLDLVLVVL